MGPPIFIGGNENEAADMAAFCNASMGPPIFIGGNSDVRRRNRPTLLRLQWGRRFSSAEMRG